MPGEHLGEVGADRRQILRDDDDSLLLLDDIGMLDHDEHLVRLHGLAGCHVDLADDAGRVHLHVVEHLHALQQHHRLPDTYQIAGHDGHGHRGALHRRHHGERLGVRITHRLSVAREFVRPAERPCGCGGRLASCRLPS